MLGQVIIAAPEATARYVEQLVARLDEAGIPSWIYLHTGDKAANEQMREGVKTCAAVVAVMFEEPEAAVGAVSLAAFENDKPILPLRLGGRPYAWLSDLPTEDVRDFSMPSAEWVDRLRRLSAGEASAADATVNVLAPTATVTVHGGRAPSTLLSDWAIAAGVSIAVFFIAGFATVNATGDESLALAVASVVGAGTVVGLLGRSWWLARRSLTVSAAGLTYGRRSYRWSEFSHLELFPDRFVAIVEPDPITGSRPGLPGRYRPGYPGYVVAHLSRLRADPFEVMITVDRFDPARDHWRYVA